MALEGVQVAGPSTEPGQGLGIVALDGVPIPREVGADVVEHPVEQNPQAAPVRLVDKSVEVGVVTEAGVDPVVVGGVVAVGAGGEDRPERNTGGSQRDGMIQPVDQPGQPMLGGAGPFRGREGADESQRVDLPPDRVAHPVRHGWHSTQSGSAMDAMDAMDTVIGTVF